MFLISGLVAGAGLAVMGMYIYALRGRAINSEAQTKALRELINLFSQRTIIATLSDDQVSSILAELSQAVYAAVHNSNPERLN
jgi:hypothetical protein